MQTIIFFLKRQEKFLSGSNLSPTFLKEGNSGIATVVISARVPRYLISIRQYGTVSSCTPPSVSSVLCKSTSMYMLLWHRRNPAEVKNTDYLLLLLCGGLLILSDSCRCSRDWTCVTDRLSCGLSDVLKGPYRGPLSDCCPCSQAAAGQGRATLHRESWTERDSQAAACQSREIHSNLTNRKQIFGVAWTNHNTTKPLGLSLHETPTCHVSDKVMLPEAMLFCRSCTFHCQTPLKTLTSFSGQEESVGFSLMTLNTININCVLEVNSTLKF